VDEYQNRMKGYRYGQVARKGAQRNGGEIEDKLREGGGLFGRGRRRAEKGLRLGHSWVRLLLSPGNTRAGLSKINSRKGRKGGGGVGDSSKVESETKTQTGLFKARVHRLKSGGKGCGVTTKAKEH